MMISLYRGDEDLHGNYLRIAQFPVVNRYVTHRTRQLSELPIIGINDLT
ncbi:hypothetical protein SIO70_29910 [Chitinophaga sancti]|nr:hypothetical protein [Chitinophaga sancti]WPQ62581.1 hypothetical protein SIO70_29910 [Chitinophaga sancti]